MEHRPLTFHHVPVLRRRIRAQDLRRAGDEIGDDRIDRDSTTGDENTRLSGRAKVGIDAALLEFPCERQGRIFLSERTIGAHGEQPPAAALASGARRQAGGRLPHVDQPAPEPRRHLGQPRHRFEPGMHPAHQIEPRLEGLLEARNPGRRDFTPDCRGTNHHAARALGARFDGRHTRQSGAHRRGGQCVLPHAALARPVTQSECGLGKWGHGKVAEENEIGLR